MTGSSPPGTLGISDSTAIWWWRINGDGGVDFLDHYSANGKPMSHFFDELDKRPYSYVKHWLPHDARARTLVTGASPLDQMLERYPGKVAIGPRPLSRGRTTGRPLAVGAARALPCEGSRGRGGPSRVPLLL
jgi:hypothetical protein